MFHGGKKLNILFINIPYVGHIIPTLVLAEELISRGHNLTYILTEEWRDEIEAVGAKFVPYQYDKEIKNEDDVNQLCYLAAYKTGLAVGRGYDLLIYEAWFFFGEILGEKLKISTIRLFTTFALNKEVTNNLLLNSNNLSIFLNDDIAKWHTERLIGEIEIGEQDFLKEMIYHISNLNIVFTSKWFQIDAERFDQRYEFVGTMISKRKNNSCLELRDDKPIILISLGSRCNKHLNFYKSCINEFSDEDYTVYISVGNQISLESFGELPENINVYSYVSQKEVLQKASLFITHGGMNSINEALYFGVPMIVIPQDTDQPFNALRVKELNLGICMQMDEIKNKLYKAAKYIIEDKEIKKQLKYARKEQRKAGGVIKAADLVEEYRQIKS